MITSELITLESCTALYYNYKDNWSKKGLSQYAKTIYCASGEDGIIEKIFSLIGGGKYYVEFGAWDGCHLSNTYNLRKIFGWGGFF